MGPPPMQKAKAHFTERLKERIEQDRSQPSLKDLLLAPKPRVADGLSVPRRNGPLKGPLLAIP
jgi:hypothetical protein